MAGAVSYTRTVEVSSNNQYKTGPFNRGDKLTARHLETVRDAGRGNAQIRNPDNFVKRLPGGHILTSKRRPKPGGTGIFLLKITATTNVNTYTADIIDNRTDETILAEDVTLKALDHTDGTIPNDNVIACTFDIANDWYEAISYSIAYGT